ncbi:hypothetical protein K440DRAFT_644713 [Wilcoxina mikolae CBS 423.85]|nr:hypothetical protein K440DRAFT_644713 [Wilcoxina mikolae CBS 423.85]
MVIFVFGADSSSWLVATSWKASPSFNAEVVPGDFPVEVSFSPSGGYFSHSRSGRLSWNLLTPASFLAIIEVLRSSKQLGALSHVFFGHGDLCLIRLDGGLCIAVGDGAETFTAMINSRAREGWSVGDRSALCPFDKRYYYLEWTRGWEVGASWCLPDRVEELVGSVWRWKTETARLHQNMLNQDLEMTKRRIDREHYEYSNWKIYAN